MSQRKPKRPTLKAEAAYENAHLVANDLLDRVRELLFDLPAPGNDEAPINWNHVGTINHVNEQLSDLIAFLDGSNR